MLPQLTELTIVLVGAALGFYFLAHHKAQVKLAADNASKHIDSLEDKLADAEARIELQVTSEVSHLRALAGTRPVVALPAAPAAVVTPVQPPSA